MKGVPAARALTLAIVIVTACVHAKAQPAIRIAPVARLSASAIGGGLRYVDGEYGQTWGTSRHAFAGTVLRLEGNVTQRWQIAVEATFAGGRLTSLDQPSYRTFGQVAERFRVGGFVFGATVRRRWALVEARFGPEYLRGHASHADLLLNWFTAGMRLAFGPRERLAAMVQAGHLGPSSVAPGMALLGVLHESERFAGSLGCGGAGGWVPALSRNPDQIEAEFRGGGLRAIGFQCASEARIRVATRFEIDLRLHFGKQLPTAAIGFAADFGGDARRPRLSRRDDAWGRAPEHPRHRDRRRWR